MGKRIESEYPKKIITDQGETVVKLVPSAAAKKIHKCLFCSTETDFYESHLLFLPLQFTGNRRYGHIECFEAHQNYRPNDTIRLHPNASNLMPGL